MTIVLGLPRGDRATAALQLGRLLARSREDHLVVCAVAPQTWPPGVAKVDAEYQEFLEQSTRAALEEARRALPPDLPATFESVRARSVPAGLLEAAEKHAASLLVLGSSASGGIGRVSLGSVADHVLHTAPLPVAMVPRGFRCHPDDRVRRVTAAYGASGGTELVAAAAGMAARWGAGLRLASFAVRSGPVVTAGIGLTAESGVLREWTRQIGQAQSAALEQVAALPVPPAPLESAIGHGRHWQEAIENVGWGGGDLLVVGSSSAGALARVFLGSRASKIVRNSPVPVIVVPRGAEAELADT